MLAIRISRTIGLASAALLISLAAEAESVHQGGYQHPGDVVRYKKTETFLFGGGAPHQRIKIYTPQPRPNLSVRYGATSADDAVSPDIKPGPVDDQITTSVSAPAELPIIAPAIATPPPHVAVSLTAQQPPATPPAQAPPRPEPATAQCEDLSVHFKWASTWVHPKQARTLIASLRACGAKRVSVSGYTCDLGSKAVNERMALGRAEEVAKILRAAGFEVLNIVAKGDVGLQNKDTANRNNNRRVDVTVAS